MDNERIKITASNRDVNVSIDYDEDSDIWEVGQHIRSLLLAIGWSEDLLNKIIQTEEGLFNKASLFDEEEENK